MGTNKAEGKRSLKEMEDEEDQEEDDNDDCDNNNGGGLGFVNEHDKKKKGKMGSSNSGGSMVVVVFCQAENCGADMSDAKKYHKRHKVCEFHAKAPCVLINGTQQRFCQQCSRFHELSEFDENKRSCRRRLAGHNERRRKNAYDYHGEGSN